MKIIGTKLVKDNPVPMIIDCTSIEIGGSSVDDGDFDEFNENYCRLYMRTYHPSVSFFVIKTKKQKNGCYFWLSKAEADEIMQYAMENDVIDLRKFGDYQICEQGRIQTVIITNDYDEWSDKEIPVVIKLEDEDD